MVYFLVLFDVDVLWLFLFQGFPKPRQACTYTLEGHANPSLICNIDAAVVIGSGFDDRCGHL